MTDQPSFERLLDQTINALPSYTPRESGTMRLFSGLGMWTAIGLMCKIQQSLALGQNTGSSDPLANMANTLATQGPALFKLMFAIGLLMGGVMIMAGFYNLMRYWFRSSTILSVSTPNVDEALKALEACRAQTSTHWGRASNQVEEKWGMLIQRCQSYRTHQDFSAEQKDMVNMLIEKAQEETMAPSINMIMKEPVPAKSSNIVTAE